MIDIPGQVRECRFRRLQSVSAKSLTDKIKTLAGELPGITITTSQPAAQGDTLPIQMLKTNASSTNENVSVGSGVRLPVYLDSDERTNRILMIGSGQELNLIEQLIDVLDISPLDLRTLQIYQIKNVDAATVTKKLQELELISTGSPASALNPDSEKSSGPDVNRVSLGESSGFNVGKPQVVINESSNELFIKATPEQHSRIASIIRRLDRKVAEDELSYKIYPLENSSPDHVADMLEKLIKEKPANPDDKIEKPKNNEPRINIVPDPNTFSLLVYASEKNHKLIGDLIKDLDKRRPQVLIDATLVEITRTDNFEYDLNIVANSKGSVINNVVISPIQSATSQKLLETGFNLLDSDGNPNGLSKAFYSDDKVQALLTAMRKKDYGRILAQPKILVDDGQQGEISTIDQTTYSTDSIQVPTVGSPITTRSYQSIEAKLQLQIVPHISEGNLLRLEVHMSREDFGTRPAQDAPPDKVTSEINTTVFVPDDNTVILGGLVKLNQSKGGSKIPILGDIPLIGFLFRSADKSDVEKKLYVFLKANIVRPSNDTLLEDLNNISRQHKDAFEKSETEFQEYKNIPGLKPVPMQPEKVLNDYK